MPKTDEADERKGIRSQNERGTREYEKILRLSKKWDYRFVMRNSSGGYGQYKTCKENVYRSRSVEQQTIYCNSYGTTWQAVIVLTCWLGIWI